MRAFLRAILGKAATLAAGWALILLGTVSLHFGGHRPGIAIFSVVLIGAGILVGLSAQLSMSGQARERESSERRNS
jgi:hypothetical protein